MIYNAPTREKSVQNWSVLISASDSIVNKSLISVKQSSLFYSIPNVITRNFHLF